jgi:hypothetical protein
MLLPVPRRLLKFFGMLIRVGLVGKTRLLLLLWCALCGGAQRGGGR